MTTPDRPDIIIFPAPPPTDAYLPEPAPEPASVEQQPTQIARTTPRFVDAPQERKRAAVTHTPPDPAPLQMVAAVSAPNGPHPFAAECTRAAVTTARPVPDRVGTGHRCAGRVSDRRSSNDIGQPRDRDRSHLDYVCVLRPARRSRGPDREQEPPMTLSLAVTDRAGSRRREARAGGAEGADDPTGLSLCHNGRHR